MDGVIVCKRLLGVDLLCMHGPIILVVSQGLEGVVFVESQKEPSFLQGSSAAVSERNLIYPIHIGPLCHDN